MAIKKVKDALLNQADLTTDLDDPEKGLVSQSNFFAQRFSECSDETVASTNIALSDPLNEVTEQLKALTMMMVNDRKKEKNVRFDPKSIRCYRCGRFGHKQAQCRMNKKGLRGRSKSRDSRSRNRDYSYSRSRDRKWSGSRDREGRGSYRNRSDSRHRNRSNSYDRRQYSKN